MRYAIPLFLAAILAAPIAASPSAAPAAGVLASMRAPVRVERPGSSTVTVELGMRLLRGDVVTVGGGGAALVYLSGGGIVRVPEGGRFELSARWDPDSKQAPAKKLSPTTMKASESGLWVLNDPDGSILVAAMRGGGDPAWADASSLRSEPLSPRYESTIARRPRFVASGGTRPARIAVASGKEIVWRSGALDGSGPWSPDGFPELDAARVYVWRIEGAVDGAPLSEWVPFRVPTAGDAEKAESFEEEMTSLASSPDGASAADVLRCGRYLETASWTPLLAASLRLLEAEPDSTVARRARDNAVRGLRLEPERIAALAAAMK